MVRGLLGLGSPRLAPHDCGRTPISFNFISDTREIPARSLSQIGSRAPPKSPRDGARDHGKLPHPPTSTQKPQQRNGGCHKCFAECAPG